MTRAPAPHALGAPARLLLAAVVAVGLLVGAAASASAASSPAAQNAVGALSPALAPVVGPSANVSPAMSRDSYDSQAITASATGVAANSGIGSAENIAQIRSSLGSRGLLDPEVDPWNVETVAGIEGKLVNGDALHPYETNWLTHETAEMEALNGGASIDAAHEAGMATHPPFTNYPPEVTVNHPDWFSNPGWAEARAG